MTLTKLIAKATEGSSQVEFAARVGVRQSTVSGWVNGSSIPPSTRLPSLAKALGVRLSDLRALIETERHARAQGDLARVDHATAALPAQGA